MQYIINEGVLTDIIWEEGDGTALVIPDGVEILDTQLNISRQIDTIILPKSIKTIKPFAFANENTAYTQSIPKSNEIFKRYFWYLCFSKNWRRKT